MYDVAQQQIRFLNAQIEERDRALANQIEAFRQQKEKADYLQKCGERNELLEQQLRTAQRLLEEQGKGLVEYEQKLEQENRRVKALEKKLTRLTGLAEDLVQEASDA
jgi:chromosome segregation ATPase